MYITEMEKLGPLLKERISHKKEICLAVNVWIRKEYGIPNFSEMRNSFFGLKEEEITLVLCRQVPSVTVENLTCHILSQILNMPIIYPSFVEDQYCFCNKEKKSYLHILWADRGRKQNLFFQGERIVSGKLDDYNGLLLSKIPTAPHIPGATVPDFHYALRKKVFGPNDRVMEVSEFNRMCVRIAKQKPEEVFVYEDSKVIKQHISKVDILSSHFRPSAEWYYPLFHAWFLDGSMIILENYDDEGDGKGAQLLFENAEKKAEKETGFSPLVLKISSHDNLLSLPRKVIESPRALSDIATRFSKKAKGDFTHFFEEISNAIFEWAP